MTTGNAASDNQPITMEEIARRLGISVATVSRALNDKPGVSEATRRQVLDFSAQLKYAPHGAARGLATTQTHTVAFLTAFRAVPLAADYFYQRIMLGAQQELSQHGYYLLVSALSADQLGDLPNLRLIQENRVDGILLAGPEIPARQILSLRARNIPLVLVDNALPRSTVDCVLSEDEQGGYNATVHLLEHGHRRIVVLTGPLDWASNQARYQGYRHAMEEKGLAVLEIHEAETTIDSGYTAMQAALSSYPDVTAVFAVNDSMAMGAMRAAREAGRTVPADLAVIGFDDIEWAAHADPPLTTVKVYKRQMGAVAARRLVQLMTNEEEVPIRSTVATQLITRASCGCS
ncbi:MAG: LacI family DNA-binding transcriptional regulator [Caldilineaceae bacterium]|nr:LacI family DNA-binding transcriptional regulator [Caldilineaceae bacterium]